MTIFLTILASLIIILGIIGCILPALPGPILVYGGLLILQATGHQPFESSFLIVWGAINVVVLVLDYVIPVLGTKALGGSKWGNWGSTIGLLLGAIVLPFAGIVSGPGAILALIFGPFIGAYIGESMRPHTRRNALKAAFGSFIGFFTGMVLKLTVSLIMAYFFVQAVYHIIVG